MAVQAGHVEVHEDEIVGLGLERGERGRAVADTVDLVGRAAQDGLGQGSVQLDIVDDEDTTPLGGQRDTTHVGNFPTAREKWKIRHAG